MSYLISSIFIGSDHAGFVLKENLINNMIKIGLTIRDFGSNSNQESIDYPEVAYSLCSAMQNCKKSCFGILICGSGIGMSIAANRFNHIRAALCRSVEDAVLSRQHNDANVLVLGERITSLETAMQIVMAYMDNAFEGGRHIRRVEMLNNAYKTYN